MVTKILSIIIPVYKVEIFIKECIESITSQITDEIEVIIIDDGTPDNSIDIIRQCLEALPANLAGCFKIIHQKNQGQSVARNVGLDIASGEYIAFLDADDRLSVNYFRSFLEIISQHKVDVICLEAQRFMQIPGDTNHTISISEHEGYFKNNKLIQKEIFNNHNWYSWLYIFKRKSFLNQRFIPNIYFEDIIFMTDLIINARNLYISKTIFYYYRTNNDSSLRSLEISNVKKQLASYEFVIKYSYQKILDNDLYSITYVNCFADYVSSSIIKFKLKHFELIRTYISLKDKDNRVNVDLVKLSGYRKFYNHGLIFIEWVWLNHLLNKIKVKKL